MSSSRRWRSQPSIWISTRNAVDGVAVPGDLVKRSGSFLQHRHVRAVLAVDRDPAPERDVADDRVARHRAAALGQPQHHVVDALDRDPVLRRGRRRRARRRRPVCSRSSAAVGSRLGRLALLEALHDLVDDDLRRDLRRAERDVEVVGLAEAHLADHVGEQRRAGDLLRRQALLAAGAPAAARGRCARCPGATRP